MTVSRSRTLVCSWTLSNPQQAVLELDGDLDFDSSDQVLEDVCRHLDENAGALREIRVDCRRLGYCDSSGLSTLLMIRRRTLAAGVRLRLDNRGPALERLLRVTSTLGHLTDADTAPRERHLDP